VSISVKKREAEPAAAVKSDMDRLGKLVKDAGIKAE
jgi:hypothetical protein